jgi:hypothetical protein
LLTFTQVIEWHEQDAAAGGAQYRELFVRVAFDGHP